MLDFKLENGLPSLFAKVFRVGYLSILRNGALRIAT